MQTPKREDDAIEKKARKKRGGRVARGKKVLSEREASEGSNLVAPGVRKNLDSTGVDVGTAETRSAPLEVLLDPYTERLQIKVAELHRPTLEKRPVSSRFQGERGSREDSLQADQLSAMLAVQENMDQAFAKLSLGSDFRELHEELKPRRPRPKKKERGREGSGGASSLPAGAVEGELQLPSESESRGRASEPGDDSGPPRSAVKGDRGATITLPPADRAHKLGSRENPFFHPSHSPLTREVTFEDPELRYEARSDVGGWGAHTRALVRRAQAGSGLFEGFMFVEPSRADSHEIRRLREFAKQAYREGHQLAVSFLDLMRDKLARTLEVESVTIPISHVIDRLSADLLATAVRMGASTQRFRMDGANSFQAVGTSLYPTLTTLPAFRVPSPGLSSGVTPSGDATDVVQALLYTERNSRDGWKRDVDRPGQARIRMLEDTPAPTAPVLEDPKISRHGRPRKRPHLRRA